MEPFRGLQQTQDQKGCSWTEDNSILENYTTCAALTGKAVSQDTFIKHVLFP
jgi:hypothetical protein